MENEPKIGLLLLAAGMGSRFGGLKQLAPLGPQGETLLEYSIYDAIQAGFTQAVFVIRKVFRQEFEEQVLAHLSPHLDCRLVFQETDDLPVPTAIPPTRLKPWGTAHAVWSAREVLRTPFAVMNADDYYGREALREVAGFLRSNRRPNRFALVGYPLGHTLSEHGSVSRGWCRTDAQGRLRAITEIPKIERALDGGGRFRGPDGSEQFLPAETLVSMNLFGFTTEIFPLLEAALRRFLAQPELLSSGECYLPAAVTEGIQAGLVEVELLPTSCHWFGITYPEDRVRVSAAIRAAIESGMFPAQLRRPAEKR